VPEQAQPAFKAPVYSIEKPLKVRESALPAYVEPAPPVYTPAPDKFIPEPEPIIEEQQTFAAVDELVDYTVIGQLFGTYVLVQSGEAAYIIDQHAAHERMNYERLKSIETLKPQKLLVPYALKLSQSDHHLLLKNADFLSGLGFGIEDFGGGTIKITSLPLRQEQGDVQALMEDVIDILQSGKQASPFRDKIVRRSCRTSIKAGEHLSEAEMRELIRELRDSKAIPVCPHGRPVAIVLTKDELEKNFKRKV
jgi:DNA mismatch repair enzyme (predicted ATPase)